MNANIGIKNFKVDVSKDVVNEIELSNGQKFVNEWKPDYNIEYDTEALTVTISTLWESFLLFAVFNDGTIEAHEVTKGSPLHLLAGELYDISFILISEDYLKCHRVEGSYPKE